MPQAELSAGDPAACRRLEEHVDVLDGAATRLGHSLGQQCCFARKRLARRELCAQQDREAGK